ncbi:MAG: TIGR02679 domain-containing protein, partial [Chloroflexota bacterium]|nr:TIGR02679 domain-containing protein [Chloroflexota bacterium]
MSNQPDQVGQTSQADQVDRADWQAMQNAREAATFFTRPGYARLVLKLYEKYIELGQVGGQITLQDATADERRDIASFLGKRLYPDTTIKVRLADVAKALMHSFNCTLPAMLRAYFPDRALVTRSEQRASHATHQAQFRSTLTAIATGLPAEARGRYWLEQGSHGQEWLYSRYKNAQLEEQERQLQLVRYIANLLNQLPQPDAPERLALFAQRTSGDPHTLDPD